MNSTISADLLQLKDRFEIWRTNRKYVREPIPDELWKAAADLSRRYPPSLVGRVLKLDSSKLKKLLIKRPARHSTCAFGGAAQHGITQAYRRTEGRRFFTDIFETGVAPSILLFWLR